MRLQTLTLEATHAWGWLAIDGLVRDGIRASTDSAGPIPRNLPSILQNARLRGLIDVEFGDSVSRTWQMQLPRFWFHLEPSPRSSSCTVAPPTGNVTHFGVYLSNVCD